MSILENVKPTKSATKFEINAYEDDIKIFNAALDFLNSKNKMTGKFTQESLFELLTTQLRQDEDLTNYLSPRKKRKNKNDADKNNV